MTGSRDGILICLASIVVLATPFDRFAVSNVPLVRNVAAIAGILFVFAYLLQRGGTIRVVSAPQRWALVFIAFVALVELVRLALADVVVLTGTPSATRILLLYLSWVQPVVLFILLADVARNPRSLAAILFGLPILMAVLTVSFFGTSDTRWSPLGWNPNYAAFVYGMSLLVAVWWLLHHITKTSIVSVAFAASTPLLLIGLIASGSRGAALGAAFGLLVLFALSVNFVRLLAITVVVISSFAVFGEELISLSDPLISRFQGAVEGTSRGGRDTIWNVAYELWMASPLWGYGLQASSAIGEVLRDGRSLAAHNTYLSLLLAFGPLGFILYFGVIASTAARLWPYRSDSRAVLFLALIAHAVGSMAFNDFLQNKFIWVMLALASQVPRWADSSAQPTLSSAPEAAHPRTEREARAFDGQ